MEPLFPIIAPGVFLNKPLRIGKAWDDIKEVNVMPSHIALALRCIPFIAHVLLYAQIVCLCQGVSPRGQPGRPTRPVGVGFPTSDTWDSLHQSVQSCHKCARL